MTLGIWILKNTFQCDNARPLSARLNPQQKSKNKEGQIRQCPRVYHYNKTTTPMNATTAAARATLAGFSAPLPGWKVAGFVADGVGDGVGDPVAVAIGVLGTIAEPFVDRVCAVPLADTCDVVIFAAPLTKPVLAVTLGAGVDTAVLFTELFTEVVVVAA